MTVYYTGTTKTSVADSPASRNDAFFFITLEFACECRTDRRTHKHQLANVRLIIHGSFQLGILEKTHNTRGSRATANADLLKLV